MDMILLDWTRMGKNYCLAGAVEERGRWRVVRPLLAKNRNTARHSGWFAKLLDGHKRWEVFELIGAQPAEPQPPHVEDLWVQAMRSRHYLALPQQRREILAAASMELGEPPFGIPLKTTSSSAYLDPGTGRRSLVTLVAPAAQLAFTAVQRQGAGEIDVRVQLPIPHLGERTLPVKDHWLLLRAARTAVNPEDQVPLLTDEVRQMGEIVAVRLGLSRGFPASPKSAPRCWLMADGFFSWTDPQP